MSHPRVLHLIGSLERGGTESQLVRFIARSSAPDHHLVVVFSGIGPLADELPAPPVLIGPVRRGVRAPDSIMRTLLDLRYLLREVEPDVVHAHLAHSEVLAALAVTPGIPIVAGRRGRTPLFETPLAGRMAHWLCAKREAVLVCNSSSLARDARRHPAPERIDVIPNGIDVTGYSSTPPPMGPPTVVVVASLRAPKGHDRFLRAFRSVRERVPEARAVLVGDGPRRAELEDLSALLRLDDAVEFVGSVGDPRPYLAMAHVVALTSTSEGLPNAVLEAMASARPVVATAVGGVPELIEEGVTGRLVPQDDRAVADALVDVLADPVSSARMGTAGRERARLFDWEVAVAATEALYRQLAATSRWDRVHT
jgi:glycosyltransferase involved in cell wall biosynthesis